MPCPHCVSRRDFLGRSLVTTGALGLTASMRMDRRADANERPSKKVVSMPHGVIAGVTISRLLLGGNLISGFMHARDLKYVGQLFRAYATEEKILETLKLAESHGINTVFETGAASIERYNREYHGHMQFIPHVKVALGQSEAALKDHIKKQVDTGAVALYIWGVSGDRLVQTGAIDQLNRAVELAKKHPLPVGVGSHSLRVPIACEKHQIPCDFYVKTFHADDYPSAVPKELRKEFLWLDGGKGWYDNMWCINPEETTQFMQTVTKPWLAFKVLAAGAYLPRQGFAHAFGNGADFIAVGMFDFQIKENCELATRLVRQKQEHKRPRPWCA